MIETALVPGCAEVVPGRENDAPISANRTQSSTRLRDVRIVLIARAAACWRLDIANAFIHIDYYTLVTWTVAARSQSGHTPELIREIAGQFTVLIFLA